VLAGSLKAKFLYSITQLQLAHDIKRWVIIYSVVFFKTQIIQQCVLYITVHCGSLRQTAQIMSMNQECLRTGDKALVHFRFIKHPEYIKPGLRLVFREGRTKAVGNVVRAIPHSSQTQSSNRSKPAKMQRYSSQQQVNLKPHILAFT
jgi:hypothetical protein